MIFETRENNAFHKKESKSKENMAEEKFLMTLVPNSGKIIGRILNADYSPYLA